MKERFINYHNIHNSLYYFDFCLETVRVEQTDEGEFEAGDVSSVWNEDPSLRNHVSLSENQEPHPKGHLLTHPIEGSSAISHLSHLSSIGHLYHDLFQLFPKVGSHLRSIQDRGRGG